MTQLDVRAAGVLLAGSILFASASAQAGAVITYAMTGLPGAAGGGAETAVTYIGTSAIKTSFGGGGVIYDDRTKGIRFYDDRNRSYGEMDEGQMAALQAQMRAMQAQLRDQLANLPEAQRKQIEAMMPKAEGDAGPKEVAYRRASTGERVGQWTCDVYEQIADGVKTAELCLAPAARVNLTAADMAMIATMGRASARMGAAAGARAERFDPAAIEKAVGYAAFPVRTVAFHAGKPAMTMTLTSVEQRALPDSTFEVPAGYAKQPMGGGMGAPAGAMPRGTPLK